MVKPIKSQQSPLEKTVEPTKEKALCKKRDGHLSQRVKEFLINQIILEERINGSIRLLLCKMPIPSPSERLQVRSFSDILQDLNNAIKEFGYISNKEYLRTLINQALNFRHTEIQPISSVCIDQTIIAKRIDTGKHYKWTRSDGTIIDIGEVVLVAYCIPTIELVSAFCSYLPEKGIKFNYYTP